MDNIRARPEEALTAINKNKLAERIDRDNALEALPEELRKSDADSDERNAMLEKLYKENRDITLIH